MNDFVVKATDAEGRELRDDRRDERAGDAGHHRADAEGDGVDALGVDADELGGARASKLVALMAVAGARAVQERHQPSVIGRSRSPKTASRA